MKKAVLFIVFNRLDTTQKAFEQIRIAKPPRLYVASDGARENKDGEKEIVDEIRNWLLTNIDWDCEVKTRFLEKNSGGCRNGMSGAINWFFEQEPDGIILEDDCVASQSFFTFCEELLDRYKDDKRVWHISGNDFINLEKEESYYFAKIQFCWGWATWADRWKYYDVNLNKYNKKHLKHFSKSKSVQSYWDNILKAMQKKEIDSWAYQWTLMIVSHKGYCINPYKNLVSNIGYSGIHFDSNQNPLLGLKIYEIDLIVHPKRVEYNFEAIDLIYKKVFYIPDCNVDYVADYVKKHKFFLLRRKFWQLLRGLLCLQ